MSKLKYADILFKFIFSAKPQYKVISVSEEEICKFENEYQIVLPRQFREFLLKIGHGAGPYNGIFSLAKMVIELENWKTNLETNGDLSKDFELANADALELIENKKG